MSTQAERAEQSIPLTQMDAAEEGGNNVTESKWVTILFTLWHSEDQA